MSLLEELASRGVTAEDLEKAASVRLFEKAAAAEGLDLDSLDVDQVEELYAAFTSNQSDTDNVKEASTMNEEIVELFEKTAAAEGIDLDEMADEDLAALYTHYVQNVLPGQLEGADKEASDESAIVEMFHKTAAAEGLDLNEFTQYELNDLYSHYVENVLPLQMGDKTAAAEIAEAQEKLAEAEILGRHMARSYMDELSKIAEDEKSKRSIGEKLRSAASKTDEIVTDIAGAMPGMKGRGMAAKRVVGYGVPAVGAAGTALAGGAGLTAGALALKKRKKKKAAEKAKAEQSKESSVDPQVMLALQVLANAGYDV